MLLAIDVGNTNIVLGVFEGHLLVRSWRLATLRERTADEIGILLDQLFAHHRLDRAQIDGIVMGSVVPPLTRTMITMSRDYFGREPLNLEPSTRTGMPILYENPADVGADRIANGVAAIARHRGHPSRGLIVVDFGTATTFDVISPAGEYLGGVICPGIQISADALFSRAARLPRIDVRKPPTTIGRTTVRAMEAGLFFGYVGLIEGLVARIRTELGTRAVCIATGGLAPIIAPETQVIDEVDQDLTLHGLRLVWEMNR